MTNGSNRTLLEAMTILITGTNRGIGKATAILAAEHGARVICHARTSSEGLIDTLTHVQLHSPTSFIVTADLRDPLDCAKMATQIQAKSSTLNALVCNASGFREAAALTSLSFTDYADEISAVLAPVINPVNALLPLLIASENASITCLTATLPQHPVVGHGAHAVAKGAVQTWIRQAARELGPQGIRVNGVGPGVVTTDWANAQGQDFLAPIAARTPLRRLASATDISGAILFLASPLGGFVTGIELPVDGGAGLN
ncbi:MAG: SDR family NAD(P)-dependent oxidoreductase [Armatimonadota bacterium]